MKYIIFISCLMIPSFIFAKTKPNVVFILADDMGWGDPGCYGHPYIQTPNIDQLAIEGTLFTSFYVNGPTCAPSRAALMTGQFPARLGIPGTSMGNFVDPQVPTVTQLLHDAGYTTGHFGKWHLGFTPDAPSPAAYGIDDVRCFNAVNRQALIDGQYLYVKDKAHQSEAIINEGIRFIEENRGKPFYVNIWLTDPHAILNPSEEQMMPYEKFRPKGVPYHGSMQIYFAVISEIDNQVGRLIRKLDELNLKDKTIVVFSSDNGPEHIGQPSGESSHSGVGSAGPFRGHKHVIYEGGIRVPFIVRWPGHTPAGNVDNITILSGTDWLPTICSLTGTGIPKGIPLDGKDMSQSFLGKPQKRTLPLMWQARGGSAWVHLNRSPQLAIRDGKWKLLMNPDKSRIELYDLNHDPGEVDNLADNNTEVAERLSKQLLEWKDSLPRDIVNLLTDEYRKPYPWPQ